MNPLFVLPFTLLVVLPIYQRRSTLSWNRYTV